MSKRRKTALAVLAAAAAAVFVLPASPASAGSATVSNACAIPLRTIFSQIEVTTSGSDGVDAVFLGGATTTSGLSQSAAIPGDIFVAGYNGGLLQQGLNNIPINAQTKIEATNTVEGTQTTNTVGGSPPDGSLTLTTVITDPNGIPGTGDESATDAAFDVSYNDLTWTAGASGTIEYRQESIATAPADNTLLITAQIGGGFPSRFSCSPGTVTGPVPPGTITPIDPAASFDTTLIQPAPVDDPPEANAGPDQTVDEGALVNLDGTGSSDPNDETLTYAWTQTGGPTVTLTGADTATPTFTSPQAGPAGEQLTFSLEVCDEANAVSLCDADTVVIDVLAPPPAPPEANAGPDQTVSEGDLVTLDGTASTDPQGETLTFNWTAPAGITLSDPTSPTPTFTAPTGPASLTFTLEVCNTEQFCDTD